MILENGMNKTEWVFRELSEMILSGALPAGNRLQATRQIAEDFQVSQKIVRCACDQLEAKHLIERRARNGMFVTIPRKIAAVISNNHSTALEMILAEFTVFCKNAGIILDRIPLSYLRIGDPEKYIAALRKERYMGILLCGTGFVGTEPEISILQALHVPVCQPAGAPSEKGHFGFEVLPMDPTAGLRLILKTLAAEPNMRIGIMVNRKEDMLLYPELCRKAGFQKVISSVIPSRQPEASLREAVQTFIGDGKDFDLIACHSGILAFHIYGICEEKGIAVPGKIHVANFGWGGAGKLLNPTLTEVDFKLKERAYAAFSYITNGKYTLPEPELIRGTRKTRSLSA